MRAADHGETTQRAQLTVKRALLSLGCTVPSPAPRTWFGVRVRTTFAAARHALSLLTHCRRWLGCEMRTCARVHGYSGYTCSEQAVDSSLTAIRTLRCLSWPRSPTSFCWRRLSRRRVPIRRVPCGLQRCVWGYRAAGWRVPLSTQQPQVLVLPSLTGCVGCAQVAKGSMRAGGRVRALLRDARAQVSERERERERESESESERTDIQIHRQIHTVRDILEAALRLQWVRTRLKRAQIAPCLCKLRRTVS